MRFQRLMEALTSAKNVLIVCHQNADPDSLGSAYALSQFILRKSPSKKVEIAVPESVNRIGGQVLQHLPVSVTVSPNLDNVDIIVLVDTNTLAQLGKFGEAIKNSCKLLVLIDHHALHQETSKLVALNITDEEATSTCEMICDLFEEGRVDPDGNVALALFLGIAYDTRHFIMARSHTFRIVAKLLDAGLVVEEAIPLLSLPLDVPERTARLKAAQRLQHSVLGEWVIVQSFVGSYHSSAARALLVLGADVAIVGGERKGILKISLRATKKFCEGTKVHLGRDIAMPLGRLLLGMGGGHNTSAGVNGRGNLDAALKTCLGLIREKVSGSKEF